MKEKWVRRLAIAAVSTVLVFSPALYAHADEEQAAEVQNDISIAVQEPETSQAPVEPQATETLQVTENQQIVETPQATDTPQVTEKQLIVEVPQATEIPQATEASEKTAEVTVPSEETAAVEDAEIFVATEISEEIEISEITETAETSEATVVSEETSVFEVTETAEVTGTAEETKTFEEAEVFEATEVSAVTEIPEVMAVQEMVESTEETEIPQEISPRQVTRVLLGKGRTGGNGNSEGSGTSEQPVPTGYVINEVRDGWTEEWDLHSNPPNPGKNSFFDMNGKYGWEAKFGDNWLEIVRGLESQYGYGSASIIDFSSDKPATFYEYVITYGLDGLASSSDSNTQQGTTGQGEIGGQGSGSGSSHQDDIDNQQGEVDLNPTHGISGDGQIENEGSGLGPGRIEGGSGNSSTPSGGSEGTGSSGQTSTEGQDTGSNQGNTGNNNGTSQSSSGTGQNSNTPPAGSEGQTPSPSQGSGNEAGNAAEGNNTPVITPGETGGNSAVNQNRPNQADPGLIDQNREADNNNAAASGMVLGANRPTIVVEDISVVFNAPDEWAQSYGDKWKDGPLFVVYRDAYGNLRAFLAEYDPLTHMLKFRSTITGNYVIVYYPYTEKKLVIYSEDFYAGLEDLIKTGFPVSLNR